MSFGHDPQRGKRAVALLATSFVVLGGAVSCAIVALVAAHNHPEAALLPVAGVMMGTLFLLFLLREPRENRLKTGWGWLSHRRKRRVPYRVRARLRPSERSPAPTGPPTIESIRQITGRVNAWVPVSAEPSRE